MAVLSSKLLINSFEFPFLYSQATRTSLNNQDAAPRMPGFFYGDKSNADYGSPQLLFCENVIPYAKGIFSIG
jgi:hypothetical protein